jgi:polygalacturonase
MSRDIPSSVETGPQGTKPDQSRIQTALNSCAGSGKAVELTMGPSGNNAFLAGPLTIGSEVTLLIDPGVTLYFSRNARDYDAPAPSPSASPSPSCGTVNTNSNMVTCQPLITFNGASHSGIMGYGKINGRGGDVVMGVFQTGNYTLTSTTNETWWNLAEDGATLRNSGNFTGYVEQQVPRGIRVMNSSDITFYKFIYMNPPQYHIDTDSTDGFSAWGIKIITPWSVNHNTDGIDPDGTTNATIVNSWISNGDDNIAVNGIRSISENITILNNHFFAGHGLSIGSTTTYNVENVLFYNGISYGNASEVEAVNDPGGSAGIHIKSTFEDGGTIQNIQFSNSCYANHGQELVFSPEDGGTSGMQTPTLSNLLFQNLHFSGGGTVNFEGSYNPNTSPATTIPATLTLDNVTFDELSSSDLSTPYHATITMGPGQVSGALSTFLTSYQGENGNVIHDNRTAAALVTPSCNYVYLEPELTGPSGLPQTVTAGQNVTVVVMLSPAFSDPSYPFPTGSVTLTDEAGDTYSFTLAGTTDTGFFTLQNIPAGNHVFTAKYSGDSVYAPIPSFGSYPVNVVAQ